MKRKLLAALLLPLAACQDVPLQPEAPYTGAVNVSVQAASTTFVRCGEEIPVTVTVTGSNGKPVSGFLVNFNVLEGGGESYAGTARTNNKGVARDYWTVGSAANVLNTLAVRAVDPATGAKNTYFTQTVTTLSKIAFHRYVGRNSQIYVMNPDGSGQTNLTNHSSDDNNPAWSPDGSKLAFASRRDSGNSGPHEIYVMNADGSNPTRLTNDWAHDYAPAWSGCVP